MPDADIIIVGSGIAALTAAEKLSESNNVIIFTKGKRTESNSFLAQGGLACAVDKQDHWKLHAEDTMTAGCFHSNRRRVEELVRNGQPYIQELIRQGMNFDRNKTGELALGREGAHLNRRILHAGGDATGKALIAFMLEKVKDKVTIRESETVLDLLIRNRKCEGIVTRDATGDISHYFAGTVILATGGCGGLFSSTSNHPSITGDGIAMAYRAGAELADMEFVQFHPTMLYIEGKTRGLISEAVRGEGAYLINNSGRRIMEGIHPLQDLAPRDVVTREIYRTIQRGEKVFLNIAPVKDFFRRFPAITALCQSQHLDLRGNLIPVVPGAHFLMGGIHTNRTGETSVPGLFAIGETAYTGVHGANRIASNSLLEGIVYGNEVAKELLKRKRSPSPSGYVSKASRPASNLLLPSAELIQKKMMTLVGVVRNKADLEKMKEWLEQYSFFQEETTALSAEKARVVNMLTVAWLVTTSALLRKESRGAHFRSDFPYMTEKWQGKSIRRQKQEQFSITG